MKVGVQALAVVFAVAVVAIMLPWTQFFNYIQEKSENRVILTEIQKHPSEQKQQDEPKLAVNEEKPLFSDEELAAEENASTETTTTPVAEVKEQKKPEATPSDNASKPTTVAAAAADANASKPQEAEASEAQEKPATKEFRGWLYRAVIQVSNIETSTEKIKNRIEELGGRKAGEVPLGWQKGTGSYFHFTIPEKNYAELQKMLEEYQGANIGIRKDKHPRVMPDGIIRFILDVKPAGA